MWFFLRLIAMALISTLGMPAMAAKGARTFNGVPVLRHRPRGWVAPKAHRKPPKKGWLTGGGVVLDAKKQKVLLVRNIKEQKKRGTNGWTFPKGKEEGAGPKATARQEVLEEGGVKATPLMHLGVYKEKSVGKGRQVLRHYYLMKMQRDTGRFDHETSEVKWVSLKKAAKMLDQKRDQSVLSQAKRALEELEK